MTEFAVVFDCEIVVWLRKFEL